MLGSNPNKGGEGVEHTRKRLEIGGYRMERTIPRRRRGHFYDNIPDFKGTMVLVLRTSGAQTVLF